MNRIDRWVVALTNRNPCGPGKITALAYAFAH